MPDVFTSPDEKIQTSDSPTIPKEIPTTEIEKHQIGGHTHSPTASFCLYPDDIDFETREDNEKIILMLRRHVVTNVVWIVMTFILIVAPQVAGMFGFFTMLPIGWGLVITLVWYLVTMAYAFENFLGWYFNVYFVTNLRIIEVDFYNLITKKVSDAEVVKVQDVSYSTSGFLGAIFNYGNVFIQTAAKVQEFRFISVSNPEKVAKIMDDFMVKEK